MTRLSEISTPQRLSDVSRPYEPPMDPEMQAKMLTSSYLADELGIDEALAKSSYDKIVEGKYGAKMKPTAVMERMKQDGIVILPEANSSIIRMDVEDALTGRKKTKEELRAAKNRKLTRQTAEYFQYLDESENYIGQTKRRSMAHRPEMGVFFDVPVSIRDIINKKPSHPNMIFSEDSYTEDDLLDISIFQSLIENARSREQAEYLYSQRRSVVQNHKSQIIADQQEALMRMEASQADTDVFFEFYKGLNAGSQIVLRGLLSSSTSIGMGWNEQSKLELDAALQRAEMTPSEMGGVAGYVANVVGQTLPYFATMATGGMGVTFMTEFGNAYADAKEAGQSEEMATLEGVAIGIPTTLIESMQLDKWLNFAKAGKTSFVSFRKALQDRMYGEIMKSGVRFAGETAALVLNEAIEEVLQEGVSLTVPVITRGDYPMTPDGKVDWAQIGDQLLGAAIGGGIGGLFLGGAGRIYNANQIVKSKNHLAASISVFEGVPYEQAYEMANEMYLRKEDGISFPELYMSVVHPQAFEKAKAEQEAAQTPPESTITETPAATPVAQEDTPQSRTEATGGATEAVQPNVQTGVEMLFSDIEKSAQPERPQKRGKFKMETISKKPPSDIQQEAQKKANQTGETVYIQFSDNKWVIGNQFGGDTQRVIRPEVKPESPVKLDNLAINRQRKVLREHPYYKQVLSDFEDMMLNLQLPSKIDFGEVTTEALEATEGRPELRKMVSTEKGVGKPFDLLYEDFTQRDEAGDPVMRDARYISDPSSFFDFIAPLIEGKKTKDRLNKFALEKATQEPSFYVEFVRYNLLKNGESKKVIAETIAKIERDMSDVGTLEDVSETVSEPLEVDAEAAAERQAIQSEEELEYVGGFLEGLIDTPAPQAAQTSQKQALDTPGQTADTIGMTGEQASRDIAPQTTAGGIGEIIWSDDFQRDHLSKDNIWLHGSHKDDFVLQGIGGNFGSLLFVTKDPRVAEKYGTGKAGVRILDLKKSKLFDTTDTEITEKAIRQFVEEQDRLMSDDVVTELIETRGVDGAIEYLTEETSAIDIVENGGILENEMFVDILINMGFDGAKDKKLSAVIFDPDNIRDITSSFNPPATAQGGGKPEAKGGINHRRGGFIDNTPFGNQDKFFDKMREIAENSEMQVQKDTPLQKAIDAHRASTPATKEQKKIAHTIQGKEGITDEEYRRIAQQATGKSSMLDMTYYEADRFINTLQPETNKRTMGKAFYDENAGKGKITVSEKAKTAFNKVKLELAKTIGTMSDRLRRISPALFHKVKRDFIFRSQHRTAEMVERTRPFVEGIEKASKEDQAVFELASLIGEPAADDVMDIVKKYNLENEYQAFREVMDELYEMAYLVGMDIEYHRMYFPRKIKNFNGLINYLKRTEYYSVIETALRSRAESSGRSITELTEEEQAAVINSLLRGYRVSQVTLSTPGNVKPREIAILDKNIAPYYHGWKRSLADYIHGMNVNIAARQFFGKESREIAKMRGQMSRYRNTLAKIKSGKMYKTEGRRRRDHRYEIQKKLAHLENEFAKKNLNFLQDSIGSYVLRERNEGRITPDQEKELRGIFEGIFSPRGPGRWMQAIMKAGYVSVLSQFTNALTQAAELIYSELENPLRANINYAKAWANKSNVKLNEITGGLGNVQEWTDAGFDTWAKRFLYMTNKVNDVGFETFINTVIDQRRIDARKNPKDLKRRLKWVYGPETDTLIADLASGQLTENVKYLAYAELTELQPGSIMEMPEYYAKGGNLRVFYMLKSFTIKRLNVIANAARNDIASGEPNKVLKGLAKLAWMLFWLTMADAGIDSLKNIIRGKPVDLADDIIDNLLQMILISKYNVERLGTQGIGGTIGEFIAPPTAFGDALLRDMATLADENSERGSELARRIPWIGEMYYWWAGEGARKVDKGYYDE